MTVIKIRDRNSSIFNFSMLNTFLVLNFSQWLPLAFLIHFSLCAKSFACIFKLNECNLFYILISLFFIFYILQFTSYLGLNLTNVQVQSYLTDTSLSWVAKKLEVICNFLAHDWFRHENSCSSHFEDPSFDIVLANTWS